MYNFSGQEALNRLYEAGYTSACRDIPSVIQYGVSAGTGDPELSKGKLMDWVEAQLEAEEESEEQESKVETVKGNLTLQGEASQLCY